MKKTFSKRFVVLVSLGPGKTYFVEKSSLREAVKIAEKAKEVSRGQADISIEDLEQGTTVWKG